MNWFKKSQINENYLKDIEYGTEKVNDVIVIKSFSDPGTLKEEFNYGNLSDGFYEGGDDRIYEVSNGKLFVRDDLRSRYDWSDRKFEITKKQTPRIYDAPIFHGTSAKGLTVEDLDIDRSGQNFPSIGNKFKGIYFSTIPSEAKTFGENLVVAKLSPNAKIMDFYEARKNEYSTEELVKNGYDVVLKQDNVGEGLEVIILNTNVLVELNG